MSVQNLLFEAVYYGTDLEFKYNGNFYFINSGKTNKNNMNSHSITVFKSKESFYEGTNNSDCTEIYATCQKDANESTNTMFEAKIFDGKSLYEIIDDIKDINY